MKLTAKSTIVDVGVHIARDETGGWSLKLDLEAIELAIRMLGAEAFIATAERHIRLECARLGLEADVELWTTMVRVLANQRG